MISDIKRMKSFILLSSLCAVLATTPASAIVILDYDAADTTFTPSRNGPSRTPATTSSGDITDEFDPLTVTNTYVFDAFQVEASLSIIPEPSGITLLLGGLAAVMFLRRRRTPGAM